MVYSMVLEGNVDEMTRVAGRQAGRQAGSTRVVAKAKAETLWRLAAKAKALRRMSHRRETLVDVSQTAWKLT